MLFNILMTVIFASFGVFIGINMIEVILLKYKKTTQPVSDDTKFVITERIRRKTKASILAFLLLIFVMVISFLIK